VFCAYFFYDGTSLGGRNIEGLRTMALSSQDYGEHERDKSESELSTHAHCNGLLASQSNVDTTREQTAHDWQPYKMMYKDFYDDGTITFFW